MLLPPRRPPAQGFSQPIRCKPCRDKKKAEQQGGGGGGGGGYGS
eukprot:gene5474-980_t